MTATSIATIASLSYEQAQAIRQQLRQAQSWIALRDFNRARITGLAARMTQAYR